MDGGEHGSSFATRPNEEKNRIALSFIPKPLKNKSRQYNRLLLSKVNSPWD